jgi:peptidoglycan-N-acetylglucosamine deacetylase
MNIAAKLDDRMHRRFNRAYGAWLCARQTNLMARHPRTIVTTFHDLEGSYGMPGATDRCLAALQQIVDIERRHGIRSTYNVVALYAKEISGIVESLRADGHEIASHSYDHSVLSGKPASEQLGNIRAAGDVFKKLRIPITGHRSPQSRWDRSLMRNLCGQGLAWTAENGGESYPYVVHRNANAKLWRFPVIADDWAYESVNLRPDEMLARWQGIVNDARRTRRYTAIGFHPWIECNPGRLEILEKYMAWLRSLPDVQVLPFGEVHALLQSLTAG